MAPAHGRSTRETAGQTPGGEMRSDITKVNLRQRGPARIREISMAGCRSRGGAKEFVCTLSRSPDPRCERAKRQAGADIAMHRVTLGSRLKCDTESPEVITGCDRKNLQAPEPRGSSLRQIGQLLGRHHGIIGRELKRGTPPGGYDPQMARLARDAAKRSKHLGRPLGNVD